MDDFLNELVGSSNKKSKKTSPKIDSNNRKRRPPPSNRNILQFLDDLSINDKNNENRENNSEKDDIYKFDFDLNKTDVSEGDKTEIKLSLLNYSIKKKKKNNSIKKKQWNQFIWIQHSFVPWFFLNDLGSSFISTFIDLSEETFNGFITERVTNFLNDINQEIIDIFDIFKSIGIFPI